MGKRIALIFGSTGAVGQHVLRQTLTNSSFDLVRTIGRREQEIQSEHHEHYCIDFDALDKASDLIKGTHLFYCIGTTIKQAGSKETFKKIDFHYGKQIAAIAYKNAIQHFALVSSIGADSSASSFYLKIKGMLENEIKQLDFQATHIVQPSFLDSRNSDFRIGESIGIPIIKFANFITFNSLKNYKPIDVSVVAAALIQSSLKNIDGLNILRGDEIRSFIEE